MSNNTSNSRICIYTGRVKKFLTLYMKGISTNLFVLLNFGTPLHGYISIKASKVKLLK